MTLANAYLLAYYPVLLSRLLRVSLNNELGLFSIHISDLKIGCTCIFYLRFNFMVIGHVKLLEIGRFYKINENSFSCV